MKYPINNISPFHPYLVYGDVKSPLNQHWEYMLNISSTIYFINNIFHPQQHVEYMAIEIVDLPSYKLVIFHSYVSLPEGKIQSSCWIYSSHGILHEDISWDYKWVN